MRVRYLLRTSCSVGILNGTYSPHPSLSEAPASSRKISSFRDISDVRNEEDLVPGDSPNMASVSFNIRRARSALLATLPSLSCAVDIVDIVDLWEGSPDLILGIALGVGDSLTEACSTGWIVTFTGFREERRWQQLLWKTSLGSIHGPKHHLWSFHPSPQIYLKEVKNTQKGPKVLYNAESTLEMKADTTMKC